MPEVTNSSQFGRYYTDFTREILGPRDPLSPGQTRAIGHSVNIMVSSYTCGNWGSEVMCKLLSMPQLGNNKASIHTQAGEAPRPALFLQPEFCSANVALLALLLGCSDLSEGL